MEIRQPMTRPQHTTLAVRAAALLFSISGPLTAQAPSPAKTATPAIPVTTFPSAPQIVAPGVISTPGEEFKATVSPDGRTLLYTFTDRSFHRMTIVQSARRGTTWGEPKVAAFSGIWRDGDPSFAPDGRSLLFISNRPLPGDSAGTVRRDFNIWKIERRADGSWGTPVALGPEINSNDFEFSPALTASGVLYFSRGNDILRATPSGTGFDKPVALPFVNGGDPAISSDDRFIVFDADGPTAGDADLYISCRTADGWTPPSRLAEPVSSTFQEGDPAISADGRTLYFFSERRPPSDRTPRSRRASYAEIVREARENVLNGSRNIYRLDISSFKCPAQP